MSCRGFRKEKLTHSDLKYERKIKNNKRKVLVFWGGTNENFGGLQPPALTQTHYNGDNFFITINVLFGLANFVVFSHAVATTTETTTPHTCLGLQAG